MTKITTLKDLVTLRVPNYIQNFNYIFSRDGLYCIHREKLKVVNSHYHLKLETAEEYLEWLKISALETWEANLIETQVNYIADALIPSSPDAPLMDRNIMLSFRIVIDTDRYWDRAVLQTTLSNSNHEGKTVIQGGKENNFY